MYVEDCSSVLSYVPTTVKVLLVLALVACAVLLGLVAGPWRRSRPCAFCSGRDKAAEGCRKKRL